MTGGVLALGEGTAAVAVGRAVSFALEAANGFRLQTLAVPAVVVPVVHAQKSRSTEPETWRILGRALLPYADVSIAGSSITSPPGQVVVAVVRAAARSCI